MSEKEAPRKQAKVPDQVARSVLARYMNRDREYHREEFLEVAAGLAA